MAKLTKKAITILRQVEAHILEEPRRLNMTQWGQVFPEPNEAVPACQTIGCVAGWTCFLTKPDVWKDLLKNAKETSIQKTRLDLFSNIKPEVDAAKTLHLTKEQAKRLFFFKGWGWDTPEFGWPKRYSDAYCGAETPEARAKVTVKRIERFIKTDGAE